MGDDDALFSEGIAAVMIESVGEELFREGAVVFFVNISSVDVDGVVFLGWVFDEGEGIFYEEGYAGIIECAVVKLGEMLLAGFDDEIINFDHMDGGE